MNKFRKLWLLFFTFARIAALVMGGGLAMLPVIEETFVRRKKLLSQEELLDVVALTQTVPGIIAATTSVASTRRSSGRRLMNFSARSSAIRRISVLMVF